MSETSSEGSGTTYGQGGQAGSGLMLYKGSGSPVITSRLGASDTIGIAQALSLGSSLDVTGAATIVGALSGSSASFTSTLGATGAVTFGSTLGVTGAATLSNTLDVSGDFGVNSKFTVAASSGNTAVTGTLDVTGATTLSSTLSAGATTLSSTLGVSGAATLSSTLGVSGLATLDSLAVTNAATLSSTLGVSGATTLSSTLGVSGAASFNNAVTIAGDLTVSGTTTTVDTATLLVEDNIIVVNSSPAAAVDAGVLAKLHPSDWGAVLTGIQAESYSAATKTIDLQIGSLGSSASANDFQGYYIWDSNGEWAKIASHDAWTVSDTSANFVIDDWDQTFIGTRSTSYGSNDSGPSQTFSVMQFPKYYTGMLYDTSATVSQFSDSFVLGAWAEAPSADSSAGDPHSVMSLGVKGLSAMGGPLYVYDQFGSSSANLMAQIDPYGQHQLVFGASSGSFSVKSDASTEVFKVSKASGTEEVRSKYDFNVSGSNYSATSAFSEAFSVVADSGNSKIAGTLDVGGVASFGANINVTVGTAPSVFTVAAASGNTAIAGTANIEGAVTIGDSDDLVINKGSITDTSGKITFGNGSSADLDLDGVKDLGVSGDLTVGGSGTFTGAISAATGSSIGNLSLANASITDSSGAISFGNNALSTTGTLSAGASTLASASVTGALSAASASITNAVSAGSFSTSGTLSAGASTLASASITGALSSGAATLDSASVTNNASVGGTLSVTGALAVADTSSPSTVKAITATGQTIVQLASGETFLVEAASGGADLFKVDLAGDLTMGNMTYDTSANTLAINSKVSLNGSNGLISGDNLSVGSAGYVTQGVAKFAEQTSAPTAASGYGFLYVKDDGDSGDDNSAELFYLDAKGAEIKITENGSLNLDSIDISLDEAYNDGSSITADAGTVLISRAASGSQSGDSALHLYADGSASTELSNSEPILQIDSSSSTFSALNAIKVDFGSAIISGASDAKGIELRGAANGGSGKSVGLAVDGSWDVMAEFGDALGDCDVRFTSGNDQHSFLTFHALTSSGGTSDATKDATIGMEYSNSIRELIIMTEGKNIVLDSAGSASSAGDLLIEVEEMAVLHEMQPVSGQTWSDGDILCFGSGGMQVADASSADLSDNSCPIGVAMGAVTGDGESCSVATIHGSIVKVSTDLTTAGDSGASLSVGQVVYLGDNGAVSGVAPTASGEEVWQLGFVSQVGDGSSTPGKIIWSPKMVIGV